ncbi:hypothetical protein [Streptomyces sp. LaPpAH-108]|uniref:hypothetical protein n=1 Tax=Streptomyces sp. LaPpAH-108 TaxID=1155714 RepID=UPI00037FD85E|nr:hypothetical protein [Streptomyces sp. LaPpAH-108]
MTVPEPPAVGAYAKDARNGRIGEVMGRVGGRVQLRPVGGGREWDVPPGELGEAEPADVLRERVRRLNRDARLRAQIESP